MAEKVTVEWLDAAGAGVAGAARAPFARVLVCDLRDCAIAAPKAIAPLPGDVADAAYPGASERSYFLQRRVVLRAFAARCAGVAPETLRIFYDEHGAPRVDGAALFVSVSSRAARAALAVASSPVGVDLEPFNMGAPVIEDVLGKSERQALAKLSGEARARAFLRIWTAKEAYLKACGRGFKRDPSLVNIDARQSKFAVEDTGFPAALMAGVFAPETDLIVACAVLPRSDAA